MMSEDEKQELIDSFAAQIKDKRNFLNMTQQQLAEMSDLSVGYVRSIEKGRVNPSFTTIVMLTGALDIPFIANF
jgi:transcriptional regulator with XRE-family HTH domain